MSDMKTKFNKAFWEWFGDSKVVDENGEPLVVYHGTSSKFDTFNLSEDGYFGKGIYFTPNYESAGSYAKIDAEMKNNHDVYVVGAYLSLKNPLQVRNFEWKNTTFETFFDENDEWIDTTKILLEREYDGIIIYASGIEKSVNTIIEIIAFSPNQIKSVNNDGTWDIDDDSILSDSFSFRNNELTHYNGKRPIYTSHIKKNKVNNTMTATVWELPNNIYFIKDDEKKWLFSAEINDNGEYYIEVEQYGKLPKKPEDSPHYKVIPTIKQHLLLKSGMKNDKAITTKMRDLIENGNLEQKLKIINLAKILNLHNDIYNIASSFEVTYNGDKYNYSQILALGKETTILLKKYSSDKGYLVVDNIENFKIRNHEN